MCSWPSGGVLTGSIRRCAWRLFLGLTSTRAGEASKAIYIALLVADEYRGYAAVAVLGEAPLGE